MFTGLIQTIGRVLAQRERSSGTVLTIDAQAIVSAEDPLRLGESIAVNGACLTVANIQGCHFDAEVLEETLRCTMFRELTVRSSVNLERALRLGDRLGGHWVSGHIDEVGRLLEKRAAGNDWTLRFSCSKSFARRTVRKGSVAVAGVSLTVVNVNDESFEVGIIPTTLRDTILGQLAVGAHVNLEADILGAYVQRALGRDGLSLEQLIAAGFAD
ncbi:MAG: riboflavin synthase [Kiritimatiellia bacterium]